MQLHKKINCPILSVAWRDLMIHQCQAQTAGAATTASIHRLGPPVYTGGGPACAPVTYQAAFREGNLVEEVIWGRWWWGLNQISGLLSAGYGQISAALSHWHLLPPAWPQTWFRRYTNKRIGVYFSRIRKLQSRNYIYLPLWHLQQIAASAPLHAVVSYWIRLGHKVLLNHIYCVSECKIWLDGGMMIYCKPFPMQISESAAAVFS